MNIYILTVSNIDHLTTILFAVKDKQTADILANCFAEAQDKFIKLCNEIKYVPRASSHAEMIAKIAQDNNFHAETFFPEEWRERVKPFLHHCLDQYNIFKYREHSLY